MSTEGKKCEKCRQDIPDEFVNLLCIDCYSSLEMKGEFEKNLDASASLISDPSYKEREEVDEIDMVSRSHGRFKGIGVVMPEKQAILYKAIRDWMREESTLKHVQYPKFIWKPKVIDIGSGLGIGTNIISQEADYVLGTDKNEENVNWANQMFMREKNNVYWSPQVDFMVSDLYTETREFMKFDVVVCIEVIEHLKDVIPLLEFIKRVAKHDSTIFISTPNRDAGYIQQDTPKNEHHVREFTQEEFRAVLKPYFSKVDIMNHKLEEQKEGADFSPMVAMCKM